MKVFETVFFEYWVEFHEIMLGKRIHDGNNHIWRLSMRIMKIMDVSLSIVRHVYLPANGAPRPMCVVRECLRICNGHAAVGQCIADAKACVSGIVINFLWAYGDSRYISINVTWNVSEVLTFKSQVKSGLSRDWQIDITLQWIGAVLERVVIEHKQIFSVTSGIQLNHVV